MNSYIGWWAKRSGQKWHLVESEVTDRLVMRCGRLMKMETKGGVLAFMPSHEQVALEQAFGDAAVEDNCKVCVG